MRIGGVLWLLFITLVAELPGQSGVTISPQPIPNEPGAILNVQSPDRGVLLPRTRISSVVNPTNGLMVFDTVENVIMLYDSILWVPLIKGPFYWFYADRDGDGWGDSLSALFAPFAPPGYFSGLDCDDTDPDIAPDLPELCDSIDNDCNPQTLDGIDELTLGQFCDGPDSDNCFEGNIECVNGILTCSDDSDDNVEECDGVDNDCDGMIDEDCPDIMIDFAVLQFPPSIVMSPGYTPLIYGQVYAQGVTDQGGQGAGILAQVGYGADGSDPSMGGWTWANATYSMDAGNNDEYQGTLNVLIVGTYDYAYRFSGDTGATWIYADLDGTTDGYSPSDAGELTVQP